MSLLNSILKALRPAVPKPAPAKIAGLFAPPYGPPPGWWKDDPAEQLRNYRSWVYAAVNAIAQEAARHKPFLYTNTGQAAHEQAPLPHTHPLCRLLDNPNPWLTPWELWYLTIVYLELTGNCFWYVAPQSLGDMRLGTPGEVWLIPTPWVKVIPDAREYVKAYEVHAPGVPTETFGPDEVIHLKYPNPLDLHYGLSPLQANALTVDANTELLKSRYQTFLAGQRPGIVLQTDQSLSENTVRRLEEKIQGRFGGRENWQRPLVLEQGFDMGRPSLITLSNCNHVTVEETVAASSSYECWIESSK